jgi:hypothetical protein
MDGSYSSDLKLRRLLLKKIARKNKKYRYGVLISATLYIIAALILLSSFVLLFKHPTTSMGIFVFICIGIIFAIIPFFIAVSINNSNKYKCALPYSSMANEKLLICDDRLEFIYWNVSKDNRGAYSKHEKYRDENKFVYSIYRNDVKKIVFEDETCIIKGKGKIKLPFYLEDDFFNPEDKFETVDSFEFLQCFNETNIKDVIERWKNNG